MVKAIQLANGLLSRFAIRQKLAASGIIGVWTYEKVGRVIGLESESNTCILDADGEN